MYSAQIRSSRPFRQKQIPSSSQGPADSAKSPSFQALRAARDSSDPLPPIQADIFQAPRAEIELYDTEADPHQVSNLAGNSTYAAIEETLSEALSKWMDATGDSVPDEITPFLPHVFRPNSFFTAFPPEANS